MFPFDDVIMIDKRYPSWLLIDMLLSTSLSETMLENWQILVDKHGIEHVLV